MKIKNNENQMIIVHLNNSNSWRGGRVVEGARLESV